MIRINKHINLVKFPGFEYPHCNCLWIEDELNCLVDVSPQKSDLDYLLKQRIDYIVNTHGHIDHYRYNHLFPDSRVMMHRADGTMVDSGRNYLDEFGFGDYLNDPAVESFYLDAVQFRPARIDMFIEEGQMISCGETVFETVHLPGHSAGHCGFMFHESGFLFTGDIDLSTFGPWYANMNCSLSELLRSIGRVLDLNPEYIVTGHGEGIVKDNYRERLAEYRDIIYQRQRRIVDLLYKGHNLLEDITKRYPVYIRPPRPEIIFNLYEKVMVLVHLKYLVECGFAVHHKGSYYLNDGVLPSQF